MITKRELTGFRRQVTKNETENALAWLNDELPRNYYSKNGRRAIVELLDSTKSLLDLTNSMRRQHRGVRLSKDLSRLALWVNRRMEEYPSWPIVMWSPDGTLVFGEDFSVNGRSLESEAATAHCILGLAEANVLDRIRRCECNRWFAGRKNQKSCSAACRHKRYERTDAFKASRRQYMREYNRLKRSGKVK